ncbi:UPF0488 protein C8orf33 homolog isoform X2 [Pseudophryne corroboree]
MNQVFGNYRAKMAEERQAQVESANDSSESQIQEVASPESHSVAYRKCSRDTQDTPVHWFTSSNSSFSFNFSPEQIDESQEAGSGDAEDKQIKEVEDLKISGQGIGLCTGEGSGFTFNFQIPEDARSPSLSSEGHVSTPDICGDQPSINHTAAAATESLEGTCSVPEGAANQTLNPEANGKNASNSAKKKKKKKSKNPSRQTQKAEERGGDVGTSSSPKEDPQPGADELWREVDWCVEQLRIAIQRQKSTPKQVEEALRAIKTLQSEKVLLVKKRQVMRSIFGDYRRKMEEERLAQLKLMQAAAKSARMSEVTATTRRNRSKVFRKSDHKFSSVIGQSDRGSADSQGSPDLPTVPGTANQEGLSFKSSQEPFCFNFF